MLPTLRPFIVAALAALLYLPADLAAQPPIKPQKVCVGKTNELIVRARCKKGEKVLKRPDIEQKLNETIIAASTGPAGSIGPNGPNGVTGLTGQIGLVGPVGLKGEVGNTGVQGAKGLIDFSGCRKYTVSPSPDNTNGNVDRVSISASCIKGVEFIYDDQYKITIFGNSLGTKVVVQSRSPGSDVGDDRDYSVTYTMNRVTSVGQGLYSVDLLVFCCPL